MKTIQELLNEKGFVENQDYTYDGTVLAPVAKTRDVEQVIYHEEVPAQYEEREIKDQNGQSFDPPQYETIEISPAQPAYEEVVIVQETYYESIPGLENLCIEAIKNEDIALIVSEYLKDKSIGDDDSLNLDLFVKNKEGWRFESVPAPTYKQLYDLATPTQTKIATEALKSEKIAAGRAAREACEAVLDLVSGFNQDRQLTWEQVTQMQQTFSNAEAALRAGRPGYAKSFISAIEVDGTLVTQEMKDLCLELLENY